MGKLFIQVYTDNLAPKTFHMDKLRVSLWTMSHPKSSIWSPTQRRHSTLNKADQWSRQMGADQPQWSFCRQDLCRCASVPVVCQLLCQSCASVLVCHCAGVLVCYCAIFSKLLSKSATINQTMELLHSGQVITWPRFLIGQDGFSSTLFALTSTTSHHLDNPDLLDHIFIANLVVTDGLLYNFSESLSS